MECRISKVEAYIKENLSQPLVISELADIACMSQKHFQREFKKILGIAPGKYMEMWKVKKGLELLKEPMEIRDIAANLGYWNYETFSRVFKKYCHIAPSELQLLVHIIEDNTEADAPAVISLSRSPELLSGLVKEALQNGTFLREQLETLQICIVVRNFSSQRSRKIEEKFSFSFEQELVPDILTRIQK